MVVATGFTPSRRAGAKKGAGSLRRPLVSILESRSIEASAAGSPGQATSSAGQERPSYLTVTPAAWQSAQRP